VCALPTTKPEGTHTVTKSEQNEAAPWKITLQKMENSLVDTGIFISPLIRFLYSLYAGEVFLSVDGIITGISEVHKNKSIYKYFSHKIVMYLWCSGRVVGLKSRECQFEPCQCTFRLTAFSGNFRRL